MARPIKVIQLTAYEEKELRRRVNAPSVSKRDSLRAEIILNRAAGKKQAEVAKELGISVPSVNKWSQRFECYRLAGLIDKSGRGRKPTIPVGIVEQVITKVTKPPKGRTRWSSRTMAEAVGISARSVRRIWKANDLKPHRTKTFKVSNDPRFEEKFWDVIGLYLDPPEKALILCCDEKSQCQALERSQPGLPLGIGHIRTKTHDYKRHGTITLFAALNYLEGNIINRTENQHTHVEWLRFLKQINRETPNDVDIHIIADNYSTHKHEKVKRWIKNHPRFHMHFTPTSSSWMNMVERFFAEITSNIIRDGSFGSIRELVNAINDYLKLHNSDPKPYRWKAKGEDILKKIQRARQTLSEVKGQQNC
jgi:transposase